jgi:hypothetical protein
MNFAAAGEHLLDVRESSSAKLSGGLAAEIFVDINHGSQPHRFALSLKLAVHARMITSECADADNSHVDGIASQKRD